MTLWERIERWRNEAMKLLDKMTTASERMQQQTLVKCAAELEADLRELRAVVERVPHIRWVAGHCGDMPACPRCALEARIGGAK